MPRTVRIPYTPHAGQKGFHESKAKFRGAFPGVGWGKSAAGANELLRIALKYPKAKHLILAANTKILKNATLPQFFKFCPPELIRAYLQSKGEIHLVNGAVILLLTADNPRHIERLRGIEIGSFWLDEGALLLYEVWKILLGRLRDANGPLRGIVTTTPKGMFHWTYLLFVRHIDPETRQIVPNPEDYAWFGGSTLDNPYTPLAWKQNLVLSYHGAYKRQEIYGEFTSFEGMVYDNLAYEVHVIHEDPPKDQVNEYIAGVDWGFEHPMAGLWIGLDHDKRAFLLQEYYERRQTVKHLSKWLEVQKNAYGAGRVTAYCDHRPEHIQELNQQGHHAVPADKEVTAGIQTVYSHFSIASDGKPRLYIHERCVNTLEEIGQYRYDKTLKDSSKRAKDEPVKDKDDAVDALRYALHTHIGSPRGRIGFLQDPENTSGLW